MKHEVIDNSIDKEGHLSAFLPWGYGGVHRLSFVFQLSPCTKKVSIQSYETKKSKFYPENNSTLVDFNPGATCIWSWISSLYKNSRN